MRTLFKTVLLLAALMTIWLALLGGGGRALTSGAVIFMIWGVSPYAVLWSLDRWLMKGAAPRVMLALALLISLPGIYAYLDIIFFHPHNDGGFTFLITPFIQWIMVVAGGGGVYWLQYRRRMS
ncbi:hypothetical protein [Larsenimonas rhizosphaerae]|uniref:hypothetical protein n=1 Tax=Larsenimonas rhizosphaerae TaxID=2944682 RepID=UPI002034989F|nr:hypothetical protein [Larsenimonas rhizosphaerae]MCM2131800.1 hypothetical protein [Larsenimonas rhizosphaerae]